MKSRKCKYSTKIKALETLANEASEDAEVAIQAYHNVLSENQKLFDEVQELKGKLLHNNIFALVHILLLFNIFLSTQFLLSGNIRVYCRVRPFLRSQDERSSTVHYVGDSGEILIRDPLEQRKNGQIFKFNKVFGTHASQGTSP